MKNFVIFYLFCLSLCINCNVDKEELYLDVTENKAHNLNISNLGAEKISGYIIQNSLYSSNKRQFDIYPGKSIIINVRIKDVDSILSNQVLSIYCYTSNNPTDNQVINVKLTNDLIACSTDDIEMVEGECNSDSYMIVSYKYKNTSFCLKTELPQNETVYCCILLLYLFK